MECNEGFFKAEPGAAACQACRSFCADGLFLTGHCSSTSEPKCQLCKSTCEGDTYLTGTCSGRQDYICSPCAVCREGEYEVLPCEGTGQNRKCAQCRSSCPTGFYLKGECRGIEQPECVACVQQTDCREDEYVAGNCDGREKTYCDLCDSSCARCKGPAKTDCLACSGDTHLQSETGECVSDCAAGTYENDGICEDCDPSCADCNGGTASQCTKCNPGTFLNHGSCVSICPEGTYENSTLGKCATCRECPYGTYMTDSCKPEHDTQCRTWTTCDSTQFQSISPTVSTDRRCSTCRTTCPAGRELSVSCTSKRNAECTLCADGKYKPGPGENMCQDCISSCSSGFYLAGDCTPTSTPVCQACVTECPSEHYLQGTCSGTESTTCLPCNKCASGYFETSPCTLSGNRRCQLCTTSLDCNEGQYLDGKCSDMTDAKCRTCTSSSQCSSNEYLKGRCAVDEPNPVCEQCLLCASDEYEVSPCTPTSNRKCSKCKETCPNGHYLVGTCAGNIAASFPRTIVKDSVTYSVLDSTFPDDTSIGCHSATSLPAGWSLVTDLDVARDVISSHSWGTVCVVVDETHAFGSTLAGEDAGNPCHCDTDAGCMSRSSEGLLSVTACPRRILIQWQPPSCRECTTTCTEDYYLHGTCGGRSNPKCRPCTTCGDGYYEKIPCTHVDVGTQNRVCVPCATGWGVFVFFWFIYSAAYFIASLY